jgi:hypothetical protein
MLAYLNTRERKQGICFFSRDLSMPFTYFLLFYCDNNNNNNNYYYYYYLLLFWTFSDYFILVISFLFLSVSHAQRRGTGGGRSGEHARATSAAATPDGWDGMGSSRFIL